MREEGPLAQSIGTHPSPTHCIYTRARPGHRAVSIRMDCVLVLYFNYLEQFIFIDNVYSSH